MTVGLVAWAVAIVVGVPLLLQASPGPSQQESTRLRADAEAFLLGEGGTSEPSGVGSQVPIGRLSIGDCVAQDEVATKMGPIENADLSVTLVDCEALNVGKIYEMTTWEKGISWRGDMSMQNHLNNMCSYRLEEIYGYPEDVSREIKWGFDWDTGVAIWLGSQPTRNAWRDYADNSVFCIAFEDNFGLIRTPDPTTSEGIVYQQQLENQQ